MRLPDRLREKSNNRYALDGADIAIMHHAAHRIELIERHLRFVLDMETNRYACASERNKVFEAARKTLAAS